MAAPAPGFLHRYLPYVLRQADQTLSEPFYATLRERGVGRSEWRVLAVLHELGPLPMVELADAALSPQPTVTHAVRRLEERGLALRSHGPDDRRERIAALTPAGRDLTGELIVEADRLEAEALRDLGDLSALVGELRRLTAHALEVQGRRSPARPAAPATARPAAPPADRSPTRPTARPAAPAAAPADRPRSHA